MTISISLRLLRWLGHRRSLPYGVRDKVLRLLVPPDAARDVPFEVAFFGHRYRGNLDNFLDWLIFFYGAHQLGLLMLLRDIASAFRSSRSVFVDIGANTGQMALFASGIFEVVHAFEPMPRLAQVLSGRLADNGIDNVAVHTVALGDHDESRPFYPATGSNHGTGTFIAKVRDEARASPIDLPVRAADRYFESRGIGSVNLIKIDTEGFEYPVLIGMAHTLRRDRPVIIMEWSETTEHEFHVRNSTLADVLPDSYVGFQLQARGDRNYSLARLAGAPALGDVVLIPQERVSEIPMRGSGTTDSSRMRLCRPRR